jgi:hypothetical protein
MMRDVTGEHHISINSSISQLEQNAIASQPSAATRQRRAAPTSHSREEESEDRSRGNSFAQWGTALPLKDYSKEGDCKKKSLLKRPRRRRDDHDEEPFIVLFGKVGVVVFGLSLVLWHCYANVLFPDHQPLLSNHLFYQAPTSVDQYDDDDTAMPEPRIKLPPADTHVSQTTPATEAKAPMTLQSGAASPLPLIPFEHEPLGPSTAWDAYSLAATFSDFDLNETSWTTVNDDSSFWSMAHGLLKQFAANYGGVHAARSILQRALSTPATMLHNSSQDVTASRSSTSNISYWLGADPGLGRTVCRIHQAKQQSSQPYPAFHIAFGGYSVTAGRGNYFNQSFPLVFQRQLHTAFYRLGLNLTVNNAAIGGCPAFPYGWCLHQFWRTTPALQAVSWDYSMNEAGGDPFGFESYLRYALQLPNQPAVLVKDTHMASARRQVLLAYRQLLPDSLVLHLDPAVLPVLEDPRYRDDEAVQGQIKTNPAILTPPGFRHWRKFGAPPGSPGQVLHHPAVKEHELIAWVLTLHFLRALQMYVVLKRDASFPVDQYCARTDDFARQLPPSPGSDASSEPALRRLPPPVVDWEQVAHAPQLSLLFGEPETNTTAAWHMNPVHCRTTFEPTAVAKNGLASLIVSGSIAEDIDVMLPKSSMFYNRAWVYDLSDGEKQTQQKLNLFDHGLGFRDRKIAYYGLVQSGVLQVHLPYIPPTHSQNSLAYPGPRDGALATEWFKSVVLCEVNEKREVSNEKMETSEICNLETDVLVTFGVDNENGTATLEGSASMLDTPGTLFLGRKICLYIAVPTGAVLNSRPIPQGTRFVRGIGKKVSSLATLGEEIGDPVQTKINPLSSWTRSLLEKQSGRRRLTSSVEEASIAVGLTINIAVKNRHIVSRPQACSISHVVWEQHSPGPHVLQVDSETSPSLG